MQVTFETWARENHPWLLDEPTDDTDRRVQAAARDAWSGGSAQMRQRCAQVCRSAAQAYEYRGRHSGPGWQVSVYLEREIRALLTAGQQEVGMQAKHSEQAPADATKENEALTTLCADVRSIVSLLRTRGVISDARSTSIVSARAAAQPAPSPIADDSRFLAFWVMVWMPLMCALFLFVVPHLINWGDAPITGLWTLAFVYAMFAPAIYRLFIQRRRESGRDG
jgi:hypothetical protein